MVYLNTRDLSEVMCVCVVCVVCGVCVCVCVCVCVRERERERERDHQGLKTGMESKMYTNVTSCARNM